MGVILLEIPTVANSRKFTTSDN